MNSRGEQRPVLCVFAKPARPGEVKTRLSMGRPDAAARLAAAFFADTWRSATRLSWLRPIVATTDVAAAQWRCIPGAALWPQGSGDLGARLERVLRRALACSSVAIAIGADTPGLPERLLLQAKDALELCDAVLGPTEDGGFYLLALKRCPVGLLRDLPWSQPNTCAETCRRLEAHGMRVQHLEAWFDVDRPADLERLRALIANDRIVAPTTAALLAGAAEEGEP